jgi:peroxiredoxin Q/BCP
MRKMLVMKFTFVFSGLTAFGFLPQTLENQVVAAEIAMNQVASDFELPNQDGKTFKLSDQKGKWIILFFYPKAGSPGCTDQVCAFRDSIKKIEARNAVLVGVSSDTRASQKEFHTEKRLSFDLLSDTKGEILSAYGVRVPVLGVATRTTFIIDPQLKVRSIARDVDPAFDAEWSAETLDELQEQGASSVEQAPAVAPGVPAQVPANAPPTATEQQKAPTKSSPTMPAVKAKSPLSKPGKTKSETKKGANKP